MHEFSTVDGFVEISESLAEMIRFIANEPSLGLFYIQQHTQNAVPNVIKLKKNAEDKSHEATLHTEDLEDSIATVRSMAECGFPIADEMIRDIKKSLVIVKNKQPKRGLIHHSSSDLPTGKSTSWSNVTLLAQEGRERSGNYFSTVFKSAKQRASNIKWPQLDSRELTYLKGENQQQQPNPQLAASSANPSSSLQGVEDEELPLSSQIEDESQHEEQADDSLLGHKLLSFSEKFEDFKADKEAQLEEWLGGSSNLNNQRPDQCKRL